VKLVVTGGAGFIGSRFVRLLLEREPGVRVLNVDKLSYSGDLSRVAAVSDDPRYSFLQADLADPGAAQAAVEGADAVFHFAAESHVDRSLLDSRAFFEANAAGTQALLTAAAKAGVKRFVHVSTDEVYGSRPSGAFRETDPLNPTNPYSVSKAAAEYLALNAFRHSGLPVVMTRGSNTYGPWQYPEKVIPLFVSNLSAGEPVPLYGDGAQERDWLHVDDHCEAVHHVYRTGVAGEIYNVSGGFHLTNLELTRRILKEFGFEKDEARWVRKVEDRLGHDRRYAMDDAKLRGTGWRPQRAFDAAFIETVRWYRANGAWLDGIRKKSADYSEYIRRQYSGRLSPGASGAR
jgi:dTDP-glucose 4,6-dehydratase